MTEWCPNPSDKRSKMIQKSLQSQQWLNNAKKELKERVELRLQHRMEQIENVINNNLPPDVCRLTIEQSIRNQIFQQAKATIDEYAGTRKLAKNQETSQQSVIDKARTWWNRTKSFKLGRTFFAVICFYLLHNFIASHCSEKSRKDRLVLFINIFEQFIQTSIKFHKTKPKPLVLQQCFLHGGEFKDICSDFAQIFGDAQIQWSCGPTMGFTVENGRRVLKYIKDKNRSQELCASFLKCLQRIKWKVTMNQDCVWLDKCLHLWEQKVMCMKPHGYDIVFLKPTNTPKCDPLEIKPTTKPKPKHVSQRIITEGTQGSDTAKYTVSVLQTTVNNNIILIQHHNPRGKHEDKELSTPKHAQKTMNVDYIEKAMQCQQDIVAQPMQVPMQYDDNNRIEFMQIPETLQCKCSQCEAKVRLNVSQYDKGCREFQGMDLFGREGYRIHRIHSEVHNDIVRSATRAQRLLQHLQSMWNSAYVNINEDVKRE